MTSSFISNIFKRAHYCYKCIVLPEGTDERVLRATEEIVKNDVCKIILIGPSKLIKAKAKRLHIKIDWKKVKIENPENSKLIEKYTETLYEIRKDKGITKKDAKKMLKNINYFGTMMVYMDNADGMVSGSTCSTSETIKPALEIIKTKEKFHKVSGIFFMVLEKRLLLFADAAVSINPDAHTLVDIATDTAETAKRFGINPKIAMLSFSTKGSAKDPGIDKIREALAIIKHNNPDLIIDGEMQVDAALVPEVAERKCPNSPIHGNANVLIFPDLGAANIAYKLVERLAKAKAIGPILQGLKKPINDLSRGCSYKDIVDTVAFTAYECCGEE